MENAYNILGLNRDRIIEDDKNGKDVKGYILEKLATKRTLIYGDPDKRIKNSSGKKSEIKDNITLSQLKEIIEGDIELLIAYDAIDTKEKRQQYNEYIKRGEKVNPVFARISPIELKVGTHLNKVQENSLSVVRGNSSVTPYGYLNCFEPENEEYSPIEDSLVFDRTIEDLYKKFKDTYEENARKNIQRYLVDGEINIDKEIENSIILLKYKWAYDRIKNRQARLKYKMEKEYSLTEKDKKSISFFSSNKKYGEKEIENPQKYVIDWDSEEFYLTKIQTAQEEKRALEEGKTIIYNSKMIAYKTDLGLTSGLYEYVVEKEINGQRVQDHVFTDDFIIAKVTKDEKTNLVNDRGYSNLMLGKIFSRNFSRRMCKT